MVKSLADVCLDFICKYFDKFSSLYTHLTPEQKETVIERLANHENFYPIATTVVCKQLLSRNLRDITLQHCYQIDDEFLKEFATCQCRLNSLDISYCKNVTDKGLLALLGKQSELQSLVLKGMTNLTGKCFASFKSSKLWFVNLKSSDAIEGNGISLLVQNCRKISYLNVSCTKLNDQALDCIAGFLLGCLEVLNCSYVPQITDEALIALADRCYNLKQLKLHGCVKISSAGVRAIFKACQLSAVDLSYCYGILAEPDILSDCLPVTLKKVVIRGTQVSKAFIDSMWMRCRQLTIIKLCGIHSITDEVIAEMTEELGNGIQELDLSWCSNLTDESVKNIVEHCTNLTKLALMYCDGITGEPFKQYANQDRSKQASNLTRLAVGACRKFKTDVLLDIFPKLKNLQSIVVSGQKSFRDEHLLSLSRNCPQLTGISIKGCVEVTDAGVCELVRYCTSLESAVLSGLHLLTDKTIFFLATSIASSLKYLFVSGCTKISNYTITYLKDVCINYVHVEHKVPNVPPDQLMARNLDTGEFCRGDLMDVFIKHLR